MKPHRRSLFFFLSFLGLVAASVVAILLKPTVLGLDLAGGSQVTLEGQDTRGVQVTSESINRSVEIIRNRIDKQGVSEPTIQTQGSNQILVQLPGITDPDVLQRLISPAQMAFYNYELMLVKGLGANPGPSAYDLVKAASALAPIAEAKTTPQYFLFGKGTRHLLIRGPLPNAAALVTPDSKGKVPQGIQIVLPAGYAFVHAKDGFSNQSVEEWAVLRDLPDVTGKDLQSARVVSDNNEIGRAHV